MKSNLPVSTLLRLDSSKVAGSVGVGATRPTYLITCPDNERKLWTGETETEGPFVWLCRNGKRLWSVPADAVRLLHPVEALTYQAQGVETL
jgi:hypothetical protein